jgi:hypothetical protein
MSASEIDLHGQTCNISFTNTTVDSPEQLETLLHSACSMLAKQAWERQAANSKVALLDDIKININTGDIDIEFPIIPSG